MTMKATNHTHFEAYRPATLRSKICRTWVSPMTQIMLASFICFGGPGMYNAIIGLGGSGQFDSTVAANAIVARLAASAASALTIVPPIFDMFGPRVCLLIGGWTYALYAASLLCYNHTQNSTFVIASGAILGLGASFVWVAQGAITVSYPLPDKRGIVIGIFWVIFNLGGAMGSFISFGLNFHSTSGTVTDSTYAAFIIIIAVGWFLSVFIVPTHKVVREDGSLASPPPNGNHISFIGSFKVEINKFKEASKDWRIWLLIPAFFCATFGYSYQQNNVNGMTFTLRSRSLNGAMYWIAQMFGGIFIGALLDLKWLTRPQRAKLGFVFIFVIGFSIWGGGLAFQNWENAQGKTHWLDFSDSRTYIGPFWLYFFYGMFDAFWQNYCYWMMGALANSPQEAAKYIGLYKTAQGIGGCVAWRINALKFKAITQLTINWALLGAALVIAIPTVLAIAPSQATIVDDVTGEEHDVKFEV